MGYAQSIVPEQPTQPLELPTGIELACQSVYAETLKSETEHAREAIPKILSTGAGHLNSVDPHGRYLQLDAGDLWDALLENEESADLAIVLGAHVTDSWMIKTRAQILVNKFIEIFVAGHAERIAKRAEELYLIERGVQ